MAQEEETSTYQIPEPLPKPIPEETQPFAPVMELEQPIQDSSAALALDLNEDQPQDEQDPWSRRGYRGQLYGYLYIEDFFKNGIILKLADFNSRLIFLDNLCQILNHSLSSVYLFLKPPAFRNAFSLLLLHLLLALVEIKRTIPRGAAGWNLKDFRTKKIFVGGIPSTVTEGIFHNKYGAYEILGVRVIGSGRSRIKIPTFVIMPIAHLVEWIYKLLGPYGMKLPQLIPSRIRIISCSRTFDCSKAKDRLGYAPIVTLQDRTREITVLAMSCNARDEPGFVFTTFEKAGRAMSIREDLPKRHPKMQNNPNVIYILRTPPLGDGRCLHKCDGSSFLDYGLSEVDPEVHAIIDKEKDRQFKSLELIAS
ncbi:hypothetical protein JHK85_034726 [Glycine max]|nr:hypothetical protein JHK85_034726 [Glycine max]